MKTPNYPTTGNGSTSSLSTESFSESITTILNNKDIIVDRKIREANIELKNHTKGIEPIQTVADSLIQKGAVKYEPHPEGGYITSFEGIPGMHDTKFYNATRLIPAEKVKGEAEDKINTHMVHTEDKIPPNHYICLTAIRGDDQNRRKSQEIAKLVRRQESKHSLRFHSEDEMNTCFAALGDFYSNFHTGEKLDYEDQMALWMYLTGCTKKYRLSGCGDKAQSRSLLECPRDSENRAIYRYSDDGCCAGLLL